MLSPDRCALAYPEPSDRGGGPPHAGGGRGPVPLRGGDLWIVTERNSRKGRLLEQAGRFSLCAQTEQPAYPYASVEGPVTSIEPSDVERDERPLAHGYLAAEFGDRYIESIGGTDARGNNVRVKMRTERWLTTDDSKQFAPDDESAPGPPGARASPSSRRRGGARRQRDGPQQGIRGWRLPRGFSSLLVAKEPYLPDFLPRHNSVNESDQRQFRSTPSEQGARWGSIVRASHTSPMASRLALVRRPGPGPGTWKKSL